MAAISYFILQNRIIAVEGLDSPIFVALMWLIPDRRLENIITHED
jgi:hypothetical protein